MSVLRSTWCACCVASLLAACLLAAAFAVPQRAATSAAQTAHAQWLRAQVDGSTDAAFEHALDAAVSAKARSLHAFLDAFVAAHAEPETLGAVFARDGLSGEALVRELQQSALGLSGVPPQARASWVSALPVATPASGSLFGSGAAVLGRAVQAARRTVRRSVARGAHVVCPVRVLSAARPMGP